MFAAPASIIAGPAAPPTVPAPPDTGKCSPAIGCSHSWAAGHGHLQPPPPAAAPAKGSPEVLPIHDPCPATVRQSSQAHIAQPRSLLHHPYRVVVARAGLAPRLATRGLDVGAVWAPVAAADLHCD